ncbi:MAG: MFS transporter, partial [Chthoniobacterales bacterium]
MPPRTATYRKISFRLLPILFLSYFFNFLDRVNVGFADLSMGESLHMNKAAFGFGAGMFFIGYFIFEVPSNLA